MKCIVTQGALIVGACIRKKSENMAENLELVSRCFRSCEVSEHVCVLSEEAVDNVGARLEARLGECFLRQYSFVTCFLKRCVIVMPVYYQCILQLKFFKRLYNYLK